MMMPSLFMRLKNSLFSEVRHFDKDLSDKMLRLSRVVSCGGKVLEAEGTGGTKSGTGERLSRN